MQVDEKDLIRMVAVHFVFGVISVIVTFLHPEFSTLSGLVNAVKSHDILVILVSVLPIFVMFSFAVFGIGLYTVGQETIGKFIFIVKDILGIDANNDYAYGQMQYQTVIILSLYIFLIIPLLLKLVWPLMLPILAILLVVYIFLA